jgi:hypothetical protein
MQSQGAAPTVDYIEIMDLAGGIGINIPNQAVNVGYTIPGWAAAYNNSVGYLGDIPVTWSVIPTLGENAFTAPLGPGITSTFDAGTIGGSVTWRADDGATHIDDVIITINPPTVDTIDIVDTPGTGALSIPGQAVGVGVSITGYAAGFNATSGYIGDVTVTWIVTPSGLEDATTDPGPADTANFNSGTIGGSVDWTADYGGGVTDTVTITINPPTVDSITIVDTAGTGIAEITNQAVGVGVTITGYAAGFNTTLGTYIMDVSVTWSVIPTGGEDASTDPGPATTADFYSGTIAGSVTWEADFGGITDTVTITINPPTVDYIDIVYTIGTGTNPIANQAVGVGITITGYAAGYNTTTGYVMDVSADWNVIPSGLEDASTDPGPAITADFYSGTVSGSVGWEADYLGMTDTVTITINPPLVDYILIVDTGATGATEIADDSVSLSFTITGWAASFNTTSGYLGDVSVIWDVINVGGSTAFTFPLGPSTSSAFDADLNPGTATWEADDGMGHTDTVVYTINAWTVDYIVIVDSPGTGLTDISNQALDVTMTLTGYAASFNNTAGYLGDISVTWTVTPAAFEDAFVTDPGPATTTTFNAGTIGGSADWTADDGFLHTDTVTITINPPTVDYIDIVDTAGTGIDSIADQPVIVGYIITGYAASFNNSIGYIGDVTVTWTVTPLGLEDATTDPGPADTANFNSGTIGGSVDWTADYGGGIIDTVTITITPPTVDWIDIVDTGSAGAPTIPDQTVHVGITITGYAAGFNTTSGYIGDVIVDWFVTPSGVEDAYTDLGPADTADFNSGTVGGSVTWDADYNFGQATDSVTFTIDTPTVDYIDIVDQAGTGTISVPDQTLVIGATIDGYAASFNNTIGYIGDISVTWSVVPSALEDAFVTDPGPAATTTFNAGTLDGSVDWVANDGTHIDTVTITITLYGTEYIEIVDTPGTGTALIVDFSVGVGITVTGYAAAFNSTAPGPGGYIGDVTVTWTVTPAGSEDATTDPGPSTTANFYSGTIAGSVDWTADDGSGNTDTVTITINPPTVDYIEIVDTPAIGTIIIPDQAVGVGITITGYAASFNTTSGYLGDISVAWSVTPSGVEDATTLPGAGTTSDFYSGTISGSVDWKADDLSTHTDTVTITIDPIVIDYIDIVDTMGTGATAIPPQSVGVGATITGYAAGFNNTIGYIMDVSVTWSVVPAVGEDASTLPLIGTSTDFYSGTIDGSVDWMADYNAGAATDSVTITILPPTVDYIEIVDTAGMGTNLISDQLIVTLDTRWGYAAAFNTTVGYMNDVSVTWTASGAAASTFPLVGTSSQFDAGATPGMATWTADYGGGITDTVTFTITDFTVDYIEIVDNPGTGATIIGDQIVNVAFGITGYAAAFNSSGGGYLGDISVAWSIVPSAGEDASTTPGSGSSSDFDSGTIGGSVGWMANDLMGHTDTVTFTINAPTVVYIDIVDTSGTGATSIADQAVDVGNTLTGYAAGFNTSIGYLYDVSVTWSVTPSAGEDAFTSPGSGTTSDFDAGTIGGSVGWEADYGGGIMDSVTITIPLPTEDYIEIVDSMGTGITAITDFSVGVGVTVTGYAAAFNNVVGYLYDVTATWTITPAAGEDATSLPGSGDTSDFYSGTIGGSVDWEAEYSGMTYTVTVTINPATIDYIEIVNTMDAGATAIPNHAVDVGVTVTGYAAGFNNTIGYIADQSVTWSVTPTAGEDADTTPASGITSDLDSGTIGGSVTWTADLGGGITDSVTITINPPTVDYIEIVDTADIGTTTIADQAVDVGVTITGYAAGFNTTSGYVMDVSADWSVTPSGTEDASTDAGPDTTADFLSGTISGSVDWEADVSGLTDTVTITINQPTADYITIVDTADSGITEILDQSVSLGFAITGYAAAFNNTADYIGDISVSWTVTPTGTEDATTTPGSGESSGFNSGTVGGSVTWTADDLSGHTDSVVFTISQPTIDYVRIVDAPSETGNLVTDLVYGVDDTDTYYLIGFSDVSGYIGLVEAETWTITPATGVGTLTFTSPSSSVDFTALEVDIDTTFTVTATDTDTGESDTTGTLTVLAPTVDYIQIEDAADNTGSEVPSPLELNDDETEVLYAAGYNDTSGYVMDVDADWTTTLGSVAPATGEPMTTYTPAAGTGTLTATYMGHEAEIDLDVADVTGPAAPGEPIVGLLDDQPVITLPPIPPSDVAEYKVQRESGDGVWETIATVPAGTLLVTDEDVQEGKTYNYRIIAVDDTGNDSPPSPSVEVKIPKGEDGIPWVMLLLFIIIVIIVILLLLFLMSRKKGEEEEMPPEEAPAPMMPEEELPPEEAGLGLAAVPPPPGAPAEEAAPEAHNCPQCGSAMEFIEDYDQYYCYTCGKYDSEFDEEGGEGGDEMPEGEGEPEGSEGEEPSGEGPEGEEPSGEGPSGEEPSGEEPPEEGGTEFEEKPPEY